MGKYNTQYRPDIDGLRALAVLSVVFYHFGFAGVPGGFVGVDVFFVISGYLITGIVIGKLESSSFSFADFFKRRFRRLFPAMFFVVVLTFCASYFLLPPPEFSKLAASSLAAIFSVSNLFFWSGTGYFDSDALTKPILHTWSLGVEEQFYLIWPILLALVSKYFSARYRIVLFVVGLASLSVSQMLLAKYQAASFFWMPLRAYEFALGAFFATLSSQPKGRMADACTMLGLLFVGYSIAYFDHKTPFPGFAALIPCVGAALIIYSAQNSIFKRALGSFPLVFIGKCSYSIYLVHWPLIVLCEYAGFELFGVVVKLAFIGITIVVGYLVYMLIEQPFRNGIVEQYFASKKIMGFSGLGIVAPSLLLFFSAWYSNGWAWRLPDELRKSMDVVIAQRLDYWESAWNSRRGFAGATNRVYVLGNSHAVDIYYALKENSDLDVTVDGTTTNKCYALGVPLEKGFEDDCKNFPALAATENAKAADFIVINERYRLEKNNYEYIRRFEDSVALISKLNPHAKIVIFGPRATYKISIYQKILEYGRLVGASKFSTKFYENSPEKLSSFDAMLRSSAEKHGWRYYSLYDGFCKNGVCEVFTPENEMIYWDHGHWTLAGAHYLHKKLVASGAYSELFKM